MSCCHCHCHCPHCHPAPPPEPCPPACPAEEWKCAPDERGFWWVYCGKVRDAVCVVKVGGCLMVERGCSYYKIDRYSADARWLRIPDPKGPC